MAKRLKLGGPAPADSSTADLTALLQRLYGLLTSGPGGNGEADGLDSLLDQLSALQTTLDGSRQADEAFKAIADVHDKLQAAIVSLQAAVDKFTPPPGYKPPVAGDEAYVRGLLSYAHKLSYSSAAPLGYQPGQPLYFFKPPAPQEAEMRASQLHAFSREWEARQQALEAQRQAAAQGQAVPAAPAPHQPAAAAVAPAVPAGTAPAAAAGAGDLAGLAARLGLDVQQLLQSMPAGWKPGDPIPGPAAAAAGRPSVAPQQQQQREASPEDLGPAAATSAVPPAAAPAAAAAAAPPAAPPPRLAGIFLNEPDFGQYEYVSDAGEGDSDDADSDSDDGSD